MRNIFNLLSSGMCKRHQLDFEGIKNKNARAHYFSFQFFVFFVFCFLVSILCFQFKKHVYQTFIFQIPFLGTEFIKITQVKNFD